MKVLGIETSCDETGISLIDSGRILGNFVSSSVRYHSRFGGVIPEAASRFHLQYLRSLFNRCIDRTKIRPDYIGLVAVTQGPGLPGALLVGISFAKALSISLGVPVIGVNHIRAHLHITASLQGKSLYPFIGLVVSGGHTSLFYVKDVLNYKLISRTRDDAVGEVFDKVARILGMGYPGGPLVEREAIRFSGKGEINFPKVKFKDRSLDFSFSGIKTAVLYYARQRGKIRKKDREMICYFFQKTVFEMIIENTILAAKKFGCRRIIVGGGVSVNRTLRSMFMQSAGSRKLDLYFPHNSFCQDNAAMIALLGEAMYNKGVRSDINFRAMPAGWDEYGN